MSTQMNPEADLPQLLDTSETASAGDPPLVTFADPSPVAGGATEQSLDAVHDVPVRVQAVLGRSRMPIGELLRLKAGMVVELDRRVGEPVDIYVNNRLIARGEVVMIDNSLGVTMTEIVQAES